MPISRNELQLASQLLPNGSKQTELSVPDMHCGGCISRIERSLQALEGINSVRVNLTRKRVAIEWRESIDPNTFVLAIANLGFEPELPTVRAAQDDPELKKLIKALAIAGFASGNVMLLSVSIWSGADESTRQLFHWLSALIAIPATIYCGQIFFVSAWKALRVFKTNMDVPISVGIAMSLGLSLYDTLTHQDQAYFEAAIMLVFFLLIGRLLDHMMRRKASSTIDGMQALEPAGANKITSDEAMAFVSVNSLQPGDSILIEPSERLPTDGVVIKGISELNTELVNGESTPHTVSINDVVLAGTLNLTGTLTIRVTEPAENSFLAKMSQLVQEGYSTKGSYRTVADRAATLYAPVVHLTALAAFVFWLQLGAGIHQSISIAITVLIITCPCALALAVPMVQTVAAQRLFRTGVIMKNGAALEKLSQIDTVVFDKTGTLTEGISVDTALSDYSKISLALAKEIAERSEHPYAKAILAIPPDRGTCHRTNPVNFTTCKEIPGSGIEAQYQTDTVRLGKRAWALTDDFTTSGVQAMNPETVLSRNGAILASFIFTSKLRRGAQQAIQQLDFSKKGVMILSGDTAQVVNSVADTLGVHLREHNHSPADKLRKIQSLNSQGLSVLMVGDGLNDSAAMAGSAVCMSPGGGQVLLDQQQTSFC